MRSIPWGGILLCASISSVPHTALAAPPQAQNKTVTLSFNHFVPANCADGSANRYPRSVTQHIYISTQGRLFAKLAARAGDAAKERLVAPSGSGEFRFSGDKIVGTFPQVSGATQVTIAFDASYQSCNATVVAGSEAGKPWSWINLVGVKCTATGKSVISNVACSVRQGNAFAN